jgi:hypothetical protein
MKVVRDSKFRHVFGEAEKTKYEDLRVASKQTEANGIRCNSKYLCFPWESGGGGTLAVIPQSKTGRQPRDLPLITGHTGSILDFEFNPFDENMLISASEDLTMKLWQLPDEGLKQHLKEPLVTLEGHGKKITFSTFNRSAAGIVASSSFDMTTRIWNINEQEQAFSIDMPEQVMHLKWNYIGSLLAATCKDKKLRIIDPRQSKFVCEAKVHEGAKASKIEWLGGASATDENFKIVTTGFTAQAERQIGIWDMRKFEATDDIQEPLNMLMLDQGTGALFPYFDHGTQMLYVAGKGDANVRYFEADAADPFLHYISDYRSTVPQRGFDFVPKRCVNVGKHEIMRGFKLESGAVQPVSWKVPRKSEAFQADLFPDAPACVPSMAADDWVGGVECRAPTLQSMEPGKASDTAKTAGASVGVVSVKDLKKQLAEAQAKIDALEKENGLLKAEIAELKEGKA